MCLGVAEAAFVALHGYPEAVINACGRTLYRTADGEYWARKGGASCGEFVPVQRKEGQDVEHELARRTLAKADADFIAAAARAASGYELKGQRGFPGKGFTKSFPMKGLPQRGALGYPHNDFRGLSQEGLSAVVREIAATLGEDFPERMRKAAQREKELKAAHACIGSDPGDVAILGVAYLRGTPQTRVAYSPQSATARYYLTQGMNECVSAAILNAQILAGAPFVPDKDFLTKLHGHLMKLQVSTDGRIDMEGLQGDIDEGRIPGLKMEAMAFADLDSALAKREPVVAVVPFFMGHAVAVVGKGATEDTYRVMDTITGLEQELESRELIGLWKFPLKDSQAFSRWVREG